MTDLDTLADGRYTAVVDTIEDGFATVFIERDGEDVVDIVTEVSELPETGRQIDAILSVTVADGELHEWEYDSERTEKRQSAAQDRFDRLSRRPTADDDS
jgi:hypothetical protein